MEVKIINPTETKELFKHWGEFSKKCYDTKNVSSEKIGKHCFKSGHFSGSRTRYIEFEITNCPRSIIDQAIRHEQGVVKNVQSTRYVDKNGFTYDIPVEIQDNDYLVHKYIKHMKCTSELYCEIQQYIINKGKSKERANEQARNVLPLGIYTDCAIGFTIEGLIHYINVRLCKRAEKEHQDLARAIRNAVLDLLPELKDSLVPQCEALLYCPENCGCGRYPNKIETLKRLNYVNKLYDLKSVDIIEERIKENYK